MIIPASREGPAADYYSEAVSALGVVKHEGGGLRVPVSAGLVYRLAKAPAYVVVSNEMPNADIRAILTSAELR